MKQTYAVSLVGHSCISIKLRHSTFKFNSSVWHFVLWYQCAPSAWLGFRPVWRVCGLVTQ